MSTRKNAFVAVAAWALAGLLLVLGMRALGGCGSSSGGSGFASDDDSGAGAGDATTTDSGGFELDGSPAGTPTGLAIDPADPTITVTSLTGPMPTQALAARATYKGGATGTVSASWQIDRLDIATVGAGTGLVTAAGAAYGKAKVTATAFGLTATTSVTVQLSATKDDVGLSAADLAKLAGATAPDPGVTRFAYPYDKTVFPKGLLPPEWMWNGGAAGDVYRLHVVAPSFDLAVITKADPPSRFALPAALWNALGTVAAGASANVAIDLERLSGTNAYASAKQPLVLADANLRGTIYYWAINEGQINKIDLPTGQRSPVFDSGPSASLGTPVPLNASNPRSPPWQDLGNGKRCVACHAVSKDGSTLGSVVSRETSTGPLGFVNLASGQLDVIGDYEKNTVFEALTPDGAFAVLNAGNKTMQLVDTKTGQAVPSTLDGIVESCDPAFSPDGKTFAAATSCNASSITSVVGYPVEYSTSNLGISDFDQTNKTFTNGRIVQTSAGVGDAIAFPSFSPDSKWIFYQRGDYARAKYGTNQHGNDDLFVSAAQSGATQLALDAANGKGVLPADSLHLNYAPTVNPIAEGGYVWVVFTSPRDYGNRMVSPQGAPPQDATYANNKQLWVTAVDATMQGPDPSHPAFWLPGQDGTSANMFGYWALAPCKPTQGDAGPQTCSAGFECCSGFCRDTGNGPVCTDQPGGCRAVGDKCSTSAECCDANAQVDCIAGICQRTTPK